MSKDKIAWSEIFKKNTYYEQKDKMQNIFSIRCIIIVFLCNNSICKKLSLSVPWYMDFYISHLSAYLPKDIDLIERALFPCPRGAKSAPSPALRQRMGRSCFLHFTSYGRPSAFSAH